MIKPLSQDSTFRLRPPELTIPQLQQQTSSGTRQDQKLIMGTMHQQQQQQQNQQHHQQQASHPDAHYCPICGQGFIRSTLLAEHMHLCHQTEMLYSSLMGSAATGAASMSMVPSTTPSTAATSNGSTTTSSSNSTSISCPHCDQNLRNPIELEEHIRTAHNMFKFSRCAACGLFGMSISNGEYKCCHCNTIASLALGHNFYSTAPNFAAAITAGAAAAPGPPNSLGNVNVNALNSKLQEFNVKQLQKVRAPHHTQHQQQHQQQQQQQQQQPIQNGQQVQIKTEIKTEPPYSYQQRQAQQPPTEEMQPNAGTPQNKRYKCPDCDKTFKTSGTLSVHRRVHNGEAEIQQKERPYSCSYCAKTFTQSNTLKQHTRIHTGEKPFHCIYCEKSFSVKDYLTKHIRTHTGEKPYSCAFCDKRFTQRSALTVHTTKLHPMG